MTRHSDETIGERIARRRKVLGLSIRQVADRAGINASTLSRIERGLRSADNRFMLADIAGALRCSAADLTGQPTIPTDRGAAEVSGNVHETVRAGIEVDLRYESDGQPPDLLALDRELTLVRDLRVRADIVGATQRLPALLRGLHAAAFGPQRVDALRGLVLAADTGSFVVRYGGDPQGACILAERAQQAAEVLEDPVFLALGSWSRAHAATGCGLYGRAYQIAERAADSLEHSTGLPDALELLGQLYLTQAFALMAAGDPEGAAVRVAAAEEIAERTGDSPALRLCFGPTNNRLWRISMEVDGGDPGRAVEIARDTKVVVLESTSRQAAFYLDTGRALAACRKDAEALRMLLAAERIAPQRLRLSPFAAETVRALLERSQRSAAGAQLRGLCSRMGIVL